MTDQFISIREQGARAAADQRTEQPLNIPAAFPSWRYHRTERPCIVNSQADADALEGEWSDAPFNFLDDPERVAQLRAEFEAKRQADLDAAERDALEAVELQAQADANAEAERVAVEQAELVAAAEAQRVADEAEAKAEAERAAVAAEAEAKLKAEAEAKAKSRWHR